MLLVEAACGDDAIPRYVAQQGEDRGDCTLPVRPCRTIQFALSVAGKGDQVRVAGGVYRLSDVAHAVQAVASAVDVQGGFDRFDHFLRQAPLANRTTLTGVPVAFRDSLQARGFQVIVDRKGPDAAGRAAIAGFQASQTSSARADCIDNAAADYPCDKVDLLAHMALADMSSTPGAAADVWGFVDLNTEREYALLGVDNGLVVIDVTEPTAPFEAGTVPGAYSFWRDVKVTQRYDDAAERWRTYAYVSTETGGRLVVVDLTGLPNVVRLGRRLDTAAHNVYVSNVDYATGVPLDESRTPPLLQVLGSGANFGAFRSFATSDPLNLVEVAMSDGEYSHDATSMRVTDDRASACKNAETCEVLLDFNESEIEIWDFSDQRDPKLLGSASYANAGYVHSGWWTEDGRYLFVHDEYDETTSGLSTTVRVFDLENLRDPRLVKVWSGPTAAIDHNGYVRGNRYYMSTYTRGLTVLDIADPHEPEEIGYFDTYPSTDAEYYSGAWGVYPFLPSGRVLVSDISGGLFVLADRTRSPEGIRVGFGARAFAGEEGDEVSIPVVRSGAGAVSVDYAVHVGSADAADINVSSGTLRWAESADDTDGARSISVRLLRDDIAEPIERAFVRLSNPTGGAVLGKINIASLFVGDPGGMSSVGFAEPEIHVDETAGRVIATIERTGSPLGAVSVDYEVAPQSASPGTDYVAIEPGRLSWADGDATARTIRVPLIADAAEEAAERFVIRLSAASGAAIANDTLAVEINGDGIAATGFALVDDITGHDLLPLANGMVLSTTVVPGNSGVRVGVRNPQAVESVGLTVDGTDTTHVANDAPYVFHVLGSSPAGQYTLRATPYTADDLGGAPGQPMRVTFFVGEQEGTLSSEAALQDLEMTGIDLDFAGEIQTYDITVGPQVAQTTVSATAAPGATVRISPVDAESQMANHQVALATGMNTIDVTVTAEDGQATRNYTVQVVRAPFVQGP